MPLLFHKVRRSKWLYRPSHFAWLGSGDVQADPVTDLRTTENKLSAFEVLDDKSNLTDIVVAVAASGQHLDVVDFILFDAAHISELGIKREKSTGRTPHEQVNSLHFDLVELSASKLASLARKVLENTEPQRYQAFQVKQLLADALKSGRLKKERMHSDLLEKLDP